MALGYETYEDDRDFKQEGLTGNVRRYTTTKMDFPCYILCSSDENPIKLHSIETLKQMFPNMKVYDETIANSLIQIYFNKDDKTVKLGAIQPSQVKTFLKLFDGCDIDGFLDKDTKLENMYLYVLAG